MAMLCGELNDGETTKELKKSFFVSEFLRKRDLHENAEVMFAISAAQSSTTFFATLIRCKRAVSLMRRPLAPEYSLEK